MSRRWKPTERAIAAYLGGERVPVSGRTRGWAPDIEHIDLAIEVKSRKRMPALLALGMDQAKKAAEWAVRKQGKSKLPILVIHQDGTHYDGALVVMRMEDFDRLAAQLRYHRIPLGKEAP